MVLWYPWGLSNGPSVALAILLAFAADTLSILTMEVMDTAVVLVVPGAMSAGLTDWLFWGESRGVARRRRRPRVPPLSIGARLVSPNRRSRTLQGIHEPLVFLGHLAALTDRIELATGVLVLPQRQTAVVAKQAAEIDILSGGRLRLKVGVGWVEPEFESLGADYRTRGRRIEEQIVLLRELWTSDVAAFKGEWDSVNQMGIRRRPVQRPIPVWLGGDVERLYGFAAATGRDPATIGIEGFVEFPADPGDPGTAVSLNDCRRELDGWASLGATHVSLNTMDPRLHGRDAVSADFGAGRRSQRRESAGPEPAAPDRRGPGRGGARPPQRRACGAVASAGRVGSRFCRDGFGEQELRFARRRCAEQRRCRNAVCACVSEGRLLRPDACGVRGAEHDLADRAVDDRLQEPWRTSVAHAAHDYDRLTQVESIAHPRQRTGVRIRHGSVIPQRPTGTSARRSGRSMASMSQYWAAVGSTRCPAADRLLPSVLRGRCQLRKGGARCQPQDNLM